MRSLLLALGVLVPASALADDVTIISRHLQQSLSVKGDSDAYVRVVAADALGFEATGPGDVTLKLRQEIAGKLRAGRTVTKLVLKQDGKNIKNISLKQRAGGKYAKGRKGRVTRAKTVTVAVPDGVHKYRLVVSSKRHAVAVSLSFGPADDGLELMALVPLGGGADADDDDDDIPLMGLGATPPADDGDEISLIGLGTTPPADDGDEISLTGLGTTTPPDEDGDAISLTGLGGTPTDTTATADTSGTTDTTGGTELAMGPTEDPEISLADPVEPSEPLILRGPGTVLAGVHGTFTQSALGAGAFGGGVEAWFRPGIVDGKVLLGLNVDFLPQKFFREVQFSDGSTRRFEVPMRSIPIMASAAFLTQAGPLDLHLFGGVGVALVSATRGGLSSSSVLPGFLIGAGPTFDIGPGRLKTAVRYQGSYGALAPASDDPDQTPIMTAGLVGGFGGTVGYLVEF